MKIDIWAFVLIIIIVMVLFFILGFLGFWFFKKQSIKIYDSKINTAKTKAIAIMNEGKANAEAESLFIKNHAQKQINATKNDLKKIRKILSDKEKQIKREFDNLTWKKQDVESQKKLYHSKLEKATKILLENSHYSEQQAEQKLLKIIQKRCSEEFGRYVLNERSKAELTAKESATTIILEAIERYAGEIVNEKTITIVKLQHPDDKGKIIGKEGRNIKTFQNYSGVEVIIDETPNIATLSSFNPVRREIARLALDELLKTGIINPITIEAVIDKYEKNLDEKILNTGQKIVERFYLSNISTEIIKMLGRLKYRTSYSQNVLAHSIEVAEISGFIAAELGLDISLARRAGLLHDIGKACDFDNVGSHVTLGVEIAARNLEDPIIINAIAAHHNDTPKESYYAVIVSAADTISAARPGSRFNVLEKHIQQLKTLEKICNEFPEVRKTFVFKSGRQIRIMLDPEKITDFEVELLILEIKKRISLHRTVPGDIIVDVIREKRFTTKII